MLEKIVSGGATGVDRAALDVARSRGIACGGWCPRGRVADDGRIDGPYPLQETPSANYLQCTEWNVRDSDGTLILTRGRPTGPQRDEARALVAAPQAHPRRQRRRDARRILLRVLPR